MRRKRRYCALRRISSSRVSKPSRRRPTRLLEAWIRRMRYSSPEHGQSCDRAIDTRVEQAIDRGLACLTANQLANGEFPVFTCKRRDMAGDLTADPSVFPTALIAHALGFVSGAASLVERASRFLLDQCDVHWVWRHWTREHPY